MLCESLPAGAVSREEAADELAVMRSHIARLENYVDAMGRLQRLEDAEIHRESVPARAFAEDTADSARIICAGLETSMDTEKLGETLYIDARPSCRCWKTSSPTPRATRKAASGLSSPQTARASALRLGRRARLRRRGPRQGREPILQGPREHGRAPRPRPEHLRHPHPPPRRQPHGFEPARRRRGRHRPLRHVKSFFHMPKKFSAS